MSQTKQCNVILINDRTKHSQRNETLTSPCYDVFISFASDDGYKLASRLAKALFEKGVRVWFSEVQLKWGDSIRKEIDTGIVNSKIGIVVLSPYYSQKKWTIYEFNGLLNRHIEEGIKLLPIWHNVTRQQVTKLCPPLADVFAKKSSSATISEMVNEIDVLLNAA